MKRQTGATRAKLTAWGLVAGGGAWAALLHQGLGPASAVGTQLWSPPAGFLVDWLAGSAFAPLVRDTRLAIAAATLPAAALALAASFLTRSALARSLALAAVLACALFAFYGIQAPLVWSFFGWRWSAAMGAFAGLVALAVLAPLWTERWLQLPWPARLATYAPVCFGLLLLERNVTGTDPTLRLSLSPWPAVQIFGLEVVASTIAVLLLGVAAGLALLELSPERPAALRGGAALAGAGLAGSFPAAPLWLGGSQGLLPFQPGLELLGVTAAAAALAYAVAGWNVRGPRRWRRTRVWAVAALLLGAPLLLGQTLTRLDYATTREQRAGRIIGALDAWFRREGTYPARLEQLVEGGDLAALPAPRIGFSLLGRPGFRYEGFGTSYLLEFSAPRWIECAYSPPYLEGEDGDVDAILEEAWSCPSRPPELW